MDKKTTCTFKIREENMKMNFIISINNIYKPDEYVEFNCDGDFFRITKKELFDKLKVFCEMGTAINGDK